MNTGNGTNPPSKRGGAIARAWRRLLAIPTYRLIQAALLVVIAVSFATSFKSGSAGARLLGFDEHFLFALPLVLDVVAAVATVIHGRVRQDQEMRKLASKFVLVPMVLSWGVNSADHLKRATETANGWGNAAQWGWNGAVVLFAGICPVAVAALLHLASKFVEFELRQADISQAAKQKAEDAATKRAQAAKDRAENPKPRKRKAKPAATDELAERRRKETEYKREYRARKALEAAQEEAEASNG